MPVTEEVIIHRLLTAIEDNANVSQRTLSQDIGIAVGSVNWYVKRCLNKGFIKLQQAPVKRYLYYLTPRGFEEKSRLTADYLHRSLSLYRSGRQECSEFFRNCAAAGSERVFLTGDGELAEIACLSALGTSVKIVAVIDPASERPVCAGVPVFPTLAAAIAQAGGHAPDAILLTDLSRPRRCHSSISEQIKQAKLSASLIHIPSILNLKPGAP